MECDVLERLFDFVIDSVGFNSNASVLVLRNFSYIVKNKRCLSDKITKVLNRLEISESPFQKLYYLETLVNIHGKDAISMLDDFLETLESERYDPWTRSVLYTCIAKIFLSEGLTEKSIQLIREAERVLNFILDNSDRSDAQKRVAILYSEINYLQKAKELILNINYQKRKIEAILDIISILFEMGKSDEIDEFIIQLPPDWKTVAIAKLANYSFKLKRKNHALSLVNRVINSISLIEDQEAKLEAIKMVLPIIIETEGIGNAEKLISRSLGNNFLSSNLTKLIDWQSVKILSPSKILTLEILIMEKETDGLREEIDKEIALTFLDLLGGKELNERLRQLKLNLKDINEDERAYYIIKISNILVEIFDKRILC